MRKHRREKKHAGHAPTTSGVSAAAQQPSAGGAVQHVGIQCVGGYRLVRVLGEGRSAVVYLARADAGAADELRRTAAIKIYRPAVALERIDAEIAALTAVEHAHVVRLLDLAATDDGRPCLVLERCAGGSLAQLVSDRRGLAAGEAVTILAPLVAAVKQLHRAGVVHRDIRLSKLLFRESGAPVLAGFGDASALPHTIASTDETATVGLSTRRQQALSPAALAADPEVLDDRRQLVTVVRVVLQLVDDASAITLDDQLASADVTADDFCGWLSDALFDLAEAQPLRRRDEVVEGASAPPVRVVRAQVAEPLELATGRSPVWARLRRLLSALVEQAKGVRRRVWVIAGGVALSLLIAAVAIPPGGEVAAPQPARRGDPASTAEAVAPTEGPSPSDAAAPEDSALSADSASPDDAAVLGDDPVAALVVLLAERQRCLRDLSVVCLDGVLQPGSAALARDVEIIRALQQGGEQTADDAVESSGPVLVERLGDSALLDLGDVPETQPASALMMRGEAGWRIRDYLDDG